MGRAKVFRLLCPDPAMTYRPGQWTDLYPGSMDGACGGYSFTSSPLETVRNGEFELIIRQGGEHPVTRVLHSERRSGDKIWVSPGQGAFYLDPEFSGNILLVGGGIGVTPLISMARTLRLGKEPRRVALIHSSRHAEDLYCADEFREQDSLHSGFKYVPWLSHSGRMDRETLLETLDFLGKGNPPQAYVCGPGTMNEEVRGALLQAGLPPGSVFCEKWW